MIRRPRSPRPLRGLRRRLLVGPLAVLGFALAAGSVLYATGGTAHASDNLVSTSQADIQAGHQLYVTHCQSCHGVNGTGGVNAAPQLVTVGAAAADFYLSTGRMPLNDPNQQPERHKPYFDPVQIRQLVAYINALPQINGTTQHGPTIPTVDPLCKTATRPAGARCVTLAEGQALFAINCAQCHQAAGSGGMLSKGNVVPSLHDATLVQSAEAPRVGPKPMPIFGTNQLTNQQVSAIAQYVQYLRHPDDPGGLGIAHFGPVAEGFVGIIIGLGVMLLAVRLIGTRG